MPDSDPSSTSSARSNRDLPAEDAGDHCRWRDDLLLALGTSGSRSEQPLSTSSSMTGGRMPARFSRRPMTSTSQGAVPHDDDRLWSLMSFDWIRPFPHGSGLPLTEF